MKKLILTFALFLIISQLPTILVAQTIPKKPLEPTTFISDEEYNAFKTNALKKVFDLGNYISTISNKDIEDDLKMSAIDNAVKLFANEKLNKVEVSHVGVKETKRFAIREYLNKVMALPFQRVSVSWYDINFVSDLQRGGDGRYYGTISVYQKFEAFQDGRLVYTDITKKDIDVVIERVQNMVDEKLVSQWAVLLGDISVVETK